MEFRLAAWTYRGDPAGDRAQVADPLDPRLWLLTNTWTTTQDSLSLYAAYYEFPCTYHVRLFLSTKSYIFRGVFLYL
jgi:hypothetical protein